MTEVSTRRFGDHGRRPRRSRPAPSWSTTSRALAERGVERFYIWFTDFANPETLAAFSENVIGVVAGA